MGLVRYNFENDIVVQHKVENGYLWDYIPKGGFPEPVKRDVALSKCRSGAILIEDNGVF